MSTLLHEIRIAFRSLHRSPVFAIAAILTLALGIGANTAMFSVVHAVLLSPAPYPSQRAEDVYVARATYGSEVGVSYLDFRDWQDRNRSFETLAAFRPSSGNVTNVDDPFRVDVLMTTWDYFPLMGVQPELGRFFTPAEDSADGPATAVLSHLLWINRFGGDPNVIGRTIHLNLRPRVIIGVLPPDFELIPVERLYVDLTHFGAGRERRDDHERIHAIGRLRPGVSADQAQAEMSTIAAALEQEYPQTNSGVGAAVTPLREFQLGQIDTTIYLLFGAVGLVLLIACSNVANLQIARSAARVRESAVRAALGAGRRRLVAYGLAESLVVSVLGGAAGISLAAYGISALRRFALTELPLAGRISLDWTAVSFALAVSAGAGLLFGLPSAARTAGSALLGAGVRSTETRGRLTLRRAFLFAQVALAMLLLAGAGLLVRTVHELREVDPGFRADNRLTFRLTMFGFQPGDAPPREIFRRVKDRLVGVPRVQDASFGLNIPLRGSFEYNVFRADDRPEPARSQMPVSAVNSVDPGYFEAFGIQLVEGRLLSDFDSGSSAPVMVVNRRLAQRFWPEGGAVGRRIRVGGPEEDWQRWTEIVGVVDDVHQDGLDEEPKMEVFVPVAQYWLQSARFVVRTTVDPLRMTESIRRAVRDAAPTLPIDEMRTMDEIIEASMSSRRLVLNLFLGFAGLALVLAALGLYGVLAYSVTRRTREIGLRMAVGAQRLDIVKLVLRQEIPLVLLAIAFGVPAAAVLSRSMEGLLFGVASTDPAALFAAATALLIAAFAACIIPARRAASIEPTAALRQE